MRRKTFDTLLTAGGLAVAVILLVAGGLLMWGHDFANSNVRSQLAEQQITFPSATVLAHPSGTEITAAMQTTLGRYAGQELLTGQQAKAYANDFINVHLSAMPYGGVYSKVSAASMAAPTNAALKAEVQTVFQGTTLRGLLLEAYGFGEMGQIALIAAISSFIGAGLMLVLSGFGLLHLRRTSPAEELLASHLGTLTPVPV